MSGLLFGACAARQPSRSIADTVTDRQPTSSQPARTANASPGSSPRSTKREHASVIATVNGRPIARHQVLDLLIRAHGPGILEQLIVLQAAVDEASRQGLTVTQHDVDREYSRALRTLVDPLASVSGPAIDESAARDVLNAVLADRNISHREFMIGIRRNAYLRAIVDAELALDEAQLKTEFDRLYGRRVVVRHMQLATTADVARCRERLANGEAFAEIARTYSANLASAANGGLLEPFSRLDDDVPETFRKAAFNLASGTVSAAVPVGQWYHLLKLEKTIPQTNADWATQRDAVERRLRDRLIPPAMRRLHRELFDQARVEIADPLLREAFLEKHPDRNHSR